MSSDNFSKTIVFCLLGKDFSPSFLRNWTEIVGYCIMNKIKPILTSSESSFFSAKMNILQTSSEVKVPFEDKIKYDYIIFLNSNNILTLEIFKQLIAHDLDVVSCLCSNKNSLNGANYLESFDLEGVDKTQYSYETMEKANELMKEYKEYSDKLKTINELNEDKEDEENKEEEEKEDEAPTESVIDNKEPSTLIKVEHVDFNVVCIKKGVFEKISLPWFNYEEKINDLTGDFYFCNKCKKENIDIYVDVKLFSGSEKKIFC